MARYDVEGDIQFVQGQMDASRKWKEEQAKKQDDFSKKLLLADGLIKGINFGLTQKAEELDRADAPKRAAYQVALNKASKAREESTAIQAAGMTRKDYLTKKLYDIYYTKAEDVYKGKDIENVSAMLWKQAQKDASLSLDEYNAYLDSAESLPSFKDFDDEYSKYRDTPRNIGQWLTSKTKNVLEKETPETLDYKKRKASDALYGTSLFNKFEGFKEAMKNYDAGSTNMPEVVRMLENAVQDGKLTGKIVGNITMSEITTTDINGITTKRSVANIFRKDPNAPGGISHDQKVTGVIQNYDNQAFLSAEDVAKMANLVKEEDRDTVRALLHSGSHRALKSNVNSALSFIYSNNGSRLAVDWADEENKGQVFEQLYQSVLMSEAWKGEGTDAVRMWYRDPKDNMVYIKPEYLDEAKKIGLDRASQLKKFEELGKHYGKRQASVSDKDMSMQGYQEGSTLVDRNKKSSYIDMVSDRNSEFFDLFPNALRINGLLQADPLDLGMIFPDVFERGQMGYLRMKDGELFIKEVELNRDGSARPYIQSGLVGSSNNKDLKDDSDWTDIEWNKLLLPGQREASEIAKLPFKLVGKTAKGFVDFVNPWDD